MEDGRKEGRKEEGECRGEEEGRDGLVEQLLLGRADTVRERETWVLTGSDSREQR